MLPVTILASSLKPDRAGVKSHRKRPIVNGSPRRFRRNRRPGGLVPAGRAIHLKTAMEIAVPSPRPIAAAALAAVLACAGPPVVAVADVLPPLPVTNDEAIAAAAATGLLDRDDFETILDPHVGEVIVGRPPDAARFSVVLTRGEGGPGPIQIVMGPPWDDVAARVELAARIAERLLGPPTTLPPPPPVEAGLDPMSPMAAWLYGLLYEAWLGWPGSERRLVRERDGIAVIVEGAPPDSWSVTFAVDRDYGDATWPGETPGLDPPAVAEARLLIRGGRYREAADLLAPTARAGEPRAARLLGDMHRFGRLGQPDVETATDWYLIGGRHRHPYAIWSLAAMHTEGWGAFFISNFKAPLLVTAAEAGSADALYVLAGTRPGVNYVRPEGVTAADQVLRAARWGLPAARFDIARRYAAGDGVARDAVEAYAWALAALDATDPGVDWIPARALADELKQGLGRAEIEAAAARSAALAAAPSPWPPDGATLPDAETAGP